jgi:hypothetical protein
MRVFLRHTRTGYYYRRRSEWAANKVDAGNFQTIERALRAIIADKLDGMSLVIHCDNRGPEQVFDLSEETPLTDLKRSGSEPEP